MRSVRLTGKTEVLKPVPIGENIERGSWLNTRGLRQFKWFHRSLAVGGAFAIVLFILGTIVDIGLFGRSAQPVVNSNDLAADEPPKRSRTPPKIPGPVFRFPTTSLPSLSDEPYAVPTVARRRLVRPRVLRAAYRPRRRPLPQVVVSQFVPTTRVIYVENGLVKSRIEPWLTASYKKPLPN
jgi:hypothetical protein